MELNVPCIPGPELPCGTVPLLVWGILTLGVPAPSLVPCVRDINKQEVFVPQNMTELAPLSRLQQQNTKSPGHELVLGAPLWQSEALLYLTDEAPTPASCEFQEVAQAIGPMWKYVERQEIPENGQHQRLPGRNSVLFQDHLRKDNAFIPTQGPFRLG